jgi:hypothetical protein
MDESEKPPRTFTVDEANTLLPQVRPLVEQLQGLARSITETTKRLDETAGKLSTGNGYPLQTIKDQIQQLTQHQLQLIEAFQSALKQLEDLGAALKDLNTGLVDFYSLRAGDVVLLCWKLGEERIHTWHTLEGGYAGRQPLD